MPHKYSEEDLVIQCQKASRKGQKRVYERFSPRMMGICLRYVKEEDEAEDLMIAGFLKVFQKIDQFKSEGSFEGWIRRIMVNECLNHLRKQRWLYSSTEVEEVAETAVEADYEQQAAAEELMAFVQDLPQGYRTVFNLYAIEGYSHKEIARQLDISENTSKSQLSRARKLLQKKIKENQDTLKQIKHG